MIRSSLVDRVRRWSRREITMHPYIVFLLYLIVLYGLWVAWNWVVSHGWIPFWPF
jgi:hypothetical protein